MIKPLQHGLLLILLLASSIDSLAGQQQNITTLMAAKSYRQAVQLINEDLANKTDSQDRSWLLGQLGLAKLALRQNQAAFSDLGQAMKAGSEDVDVRYEIGLAHLFGRGTAQDINEGIRLLLDPAKSGHHPSQIALYQIYRQHRRATQATRWLKMAADGGDNKAQLILGRLYHSGNFLKADGYEGVRWLFSAAENGNAIAQAELANQYRLGKHVTASEERALKWITSSLAEDNFDANYYYANMHELGFAVPQNHSAATYWYWRAAQQQHVASQIKLAEKYLNGEGITQDFVAARNWLLASSALPAAKQHLGTIYQHGIGVAQDLPKALSYYQQINNGSMELSNKKTLLKLLINNDPKEIEDFKLQMAEINDPNQMNGMAWLLATEAPLREPFPELALSLATRATAIAETVAFLDTLAAAQAATGNYRTARRTQRKAIRKLDDNDPLKSELKAHLDLYESKKPIRISYTDSNNDGEYQAPQPTYEITGLITRISAIDDHRQRGFYLSPKEEANFLIEMVVQKHGLKDPSASGLQPTFPYDFREYLILYTHSPTQLFSSLDLKLGAMEYPQTPVTIILSEDYPQGYKATAVWPSDR